MLTFNKIEEKIKICLEKALKPNIKFPLNFHHAYNPHPLL